MYPNSNSHPAPLNPSFWIYSDGSTYDGKFLDEVFTESLCRMLNNGMGKYLLRWPKPFTVAENYFNNFSPFQL